MKKIIKRNRKALGLSTRRVNVNYMLMLNSIVEVFLVRSTDPKFAPSRCLNGVILADGLIVGFEEE